MRVRTNFSLVLAAIWAIPCVVLPARVIAQDAKFHEAPSSSAQQKNPYEGQQTAVAAGAKLYAANCAACHGSNGQGAGTIPAVSQGATQSAPDGEIFWFITTGSVNNGMPAWGSLSEQKRWQIVAFLKSLKNSGGIGKISTMPSAH